MNKYNKQGIKAIREAGFSFVAKSSNDYPRNTGVSVPTLAAVETALIKLSYDGYNVNASQKLIAKLACVSENTVQRAISVLRKIGRVFVKHMYKNDKATGQVRRVASSVRLSSFIQHIERIKNHATTYIGKAFLRVSEASKSPVPHKRMSQLLYNNIQGYETSDFAKKEMESLVVSVETGEILNR